MAVYDLEEQEKISELKAWWDRWGTLLTLLAVLFAVIAVGWRVYNWRMDTQSMQAAELYHTFSEAAATGKDLDAVQKQAAQIRADFPKSHYAVMAALDAARVLFDGGKFPEAAGELEWVQTHADDTALRDLARVRLAVVLAQQQKYDEAAAKLQPVPASPMLAARFSDVLGDVLAAQKKFAEARDAWKSALDTLAAAGVAEGDPRREFVRLKLESIAGS